MAVGSKEMDDVVHGAPRAREQDGVRTFLSGPPGLPSALAAVGMGKVLLPCGLVSFEESWAGARSGSV